MANENIILLNKKQKNSCSCFFYTRSISQCIFFVFRKTCWTSNH